MKKLFEKPDDPRWLNFNYPPLIYIVHYTEECLNQQYLKIAKSLRRTFLLVIANLFLGLINTITQATSHNTCAEVSLTAIIYAILSKLPVFFYTHFSRISIFNVDMILIAYLALGVFWTGYYSLCVKSKPWLLVYYALTLL